MNATAIDKTSDLDMPDGLGEPGRRAYEIIVAYLKERGRAGTGGCKAFYSSTEWKVMGREYGTRSHLVIAYERGDLGPVFSMDAAYSLDCAHYQKTGKAREPYGLYEGMQTKLREAGLYFEECTRWYSAIYTLDSKDSVQEDDA